MKAKSDIAGIDEKKQEGNRGPDAIAALPDGPSHDEIERRAYEIHLERGASHGSDMDDWLQAERELRAKYPTC